MKLLIVTQYFWPENFRINDLVAQLVRRGHQVTVLTGSPNYPGGEIYPDFKANRASYARFEGAEVVRVGLLPRGQGAARLMLNYLSFALTASLIGPWKLRRRNYDAIFVFEPSPITVGIPAIVLKWIKRAPIAFWVLDLWPQSLRAVGAVRSEVVLNLVEGLVRIIYRNCDVVLAQSKSFMHVITQQIGDASRIKYFPSWAEDVALDRDAVPAPEIEHRPDLFNIVFTGNIGEAQDFDAVLDAVEGLRNEPVRWIIVGDGRKASWLAEEVTRRGLKERLLLPGRFGLERMPSFFRHADALLVSLRNDPVFAQTIPGKVQTYLAAGVPILAMLDGEGAQVITEGGAGLAVAAGDSAALIYAVRHMVSMSQKQRVEMGQRGPALIMSDFNRDHLLTQLEATLFDLSTRRSKNPSSK